MAICPNNSYLILASDPLFTGTYTKTSSVDVVHGVEFSRYQKDSVTQLFVQSSAGPGSPFFWTVQRPAAYGSVYGYQWPQVSSGGSSCPIDGSVSSLAINIGGSAKIINTASLRSTRQKLYVSSTAEYEGSIFSGEYTLQSDAYNNFSWWKNAATQAVIVFGKEFPMGLFVRHYIFKSKTQADSYFAGSTSNIFFAESYDFTILESITPFEFSGLYLLGTYQGLTGRTLISHKPFQSPLPENEDYAALIGFFGRNGASFEFKDLDNYGLYTFKTANGLYNGTSTFLLANLSGQALPNPVFLEWIKSLKRSVDYEIDGKKLFLNKNSERLKNIAGFFGDSQLQLNKLDTSPLDLKTVTLNDSKVNTVVLGEVRDTIVVNNVTSVDSQPINFELKGEYSGQFSLTNLQFNNFVVRKTNALSKISYLNHSNSLSLLNSDAREDLIEKLSENDAVVTYELNGLFSDDKIETVTNPAVKQKAISAKASATARRSGSGSGSGSGLGIGTSFLYGDSSNLSLWFKAREDSSETYSTPFNRWSNNVFLGHLLENTGGTNYPTSVFETVTISGAVVSNPGGYELPINGEYTRTGSVNGRPKFQKSSGNGGSLQVFWAGTWYIFYTNAALAENASLYYSNSSSLSPSSLSFISSTILPSVTGGTYAGTPTSAWSPAHASFDGTQYLTIPNLLTGDSAEVFAVCKFDDLPVGEENGPLIGNIGTASEYERYIKQAGGAANARISLFRSSSINAEPNATNPFSNITKWCLLKFSAPAGLSYSFGINDGSEGFFNPATQVFYPSDFSRTTYAANLISEGPYIGRSTQGGDIKFKGKIAEIMLYNRALTYSERTVVQNYLNSKYSLWT